MRRVGLVLVAVVLLVVVARLAVGGGDRDRRVETARSATAVDPGVAARGAHALARQGPLLVRLLSVSGLEVARARVEGERVELAVGALAGVQEGSRLDALGTSVEVAAVDPSRLLAPLVERVARWEGGHLRLEGTPLAVAWLDREGRLVGLEVDLDGGGRLAVGPAP